MTALSAPSTGGPLVSFLLFTYRQEAYIEAAMNAALAQTYEPLEIIVSDDASPDGTFAIIERIARDYRGPHRLTINRNPVNLGMGAHYEHVFGVAQGELFVTAAGDDVSTPDRTDRIVEAFGRDPNIGIVYSDMRIIDAAGAAIGPYTHFYSKDQVNDLASFLWTGATIFGASFAITRALHDRFPSIMRWNEIEDRTLIFRCLALGRTLEWIREPLVQWRQVGRSSGTNLVYSDARRTRLQRYLADEVCTRWLVGSYRQHLIDYWSIGAPDRRIERTLDTRARELAFVHALWRGDDPRWRNLFATVRSGGRLGPMLKVFLKFEFIGAYLALIETWRRLRRSGSPAQKSERT